MLAAVIRASIRIGLAVASLLWLALAAQAVFGLGWTVVEPLSKTKGYRPSANDASWTVSIPKSLRSRTLTENSGVFLEDGKPLWRVENHHAEEIGDRGWFLMHPNTVTFCLSDGADPRTARRKLEIEAPRPSPWWLVAGSFVLLAAGHVAAGRQGIDAGLFSSWIRQVNGWASRRWWAPALFTAALISRSALVAGWEDLNDGFMMAKGMPYSDAMGWTETARHLARGEGMIGGFEGQRPLYPTLLGALMTLAGVKLQWAPWLGAVLGAVAAGVGGWLTSRVAGAWAGVAAMLYLAVGGQQSLLAALPMTEGPSLAFLLTALFCWWRGVERQRWGWLGLGGVFIGLANLTCTFTLLAWPLAGMIAAWRWGRAESGRRAFSGWFVRSAAVAAGGMLVLLPWVIRNANRYGLPTISVQSAELLYGSVSPEHHLTPAMAAEADKAGIPNTIPDRYRFFQKRFADTVKADPLNYLKLLAQGARGHLRFFEPSERHARLIWMLMPLVFLFSSGRIGSVRAWLGCGVATAAAWSVGLLTGEWAIGLIVAGSVLTKSRQHLVLALLLSALVLGVAGMSAMVGSSIVRRLWSSADWAVVILGILAMDTVFRAIAGSEPTTEPTETQGASRFMNGVPICLGSATILAVAIVSIRTSVGPVATPPKDSAEAAHQALEKVAALPGPAGAPQRPVAEALTLDLYATRIGRGENLHHWSRAFLRRDRARTVAFMRSVDGNGLLCVQIGGREVDLPKGEPVMVVSRLSEDPKAILHHETVLREAIAVYELTDAGDRWKLGRLLTEDPAAAGP